MTTNSPPSRNAAGDGTLIGLLSLFRAKLIQNLDDMLPAQVIAYDRTTNRAQVQPMIFMVSTKNELISRAQIASVPVVQIGGGGFVMSFPINTGDFGWIKTNDRDISFFKSTFQQSAPNTQRKHSFSDAVFIPDSMMKDVVINDEDANNLVIQNLAGTVRIAIWGDKVKITAPSVVIDTPATHCTGNLQVDGNISVTGTSDLTGDITVHNDINVIGTATIDGIPFDTHRHTGVQTGSGDTGAPIA